MKQVLNDCSTEQVMAHIRQIWQCYDKDGHGYMSKQEAKHFCARYFKHENQVPSEIDDKIFEDWFRTLDKDGDGRVDVTEIAAYLKILAH